MRMIRVWHWFSNTFIVKTKFAFSSDYNLSSFLLEPTIQKAYLWIPMKAYDVSMIKKTNWFHHQKWISECYYF